MKWGNSNWKQRLGQQSSTKLYHSGCLTIISTTDQSMLMALWRQNELFQTPCRTLLLYQTRNRMTQVQTTFTSGLISRVKALWLNCSLTKWTGSATTVFLRLWTSSLKTLSNTGRGTATRIASLKVSSKQLCLTCLWTRVSIFWIEWTRLLRIKTTEWISSTIMAFKCSQLRTFINGRIHQLGISILPRKLKMAKREISGFLKIYLVSATSTKALNLKFTLFFLSTAAALISRNLGRARMHLREHLLQLTSMLFLRSKANNI